MCVWVCVHLLVYMWAQYSLQLLKNLQPFSLTHCSTGPFTLQGSLAEPLILRAKCCCAGKTGPPGVPESHSIPLYLCAAQKALRDRADLSLLSLSTLNTSLNLGSDKSKPFRRGGGCGAPFASLELNLHCLVITSEGNNVFFFIIIFTQWGFLGQLICCPHQCIN